MKKTFILIIFLLFSNKVFSSDEKEGRFFDKTKGRKIKGIKFPFLYSTSLMVDGRII